MPESTFHHHAVTAAQMSVVWESLQDPRNWATVTSLDETRDHVYSGNALQGFRFTTRIGGVGYRGEALVTESTPPESMTLEVRSPELRGSIRTELATVDDGTLLDVTMTMRPAGLMGSLVFGIVSAVVAEGFEDSVERLARQVSSP